MTIISTIPTTANPWMTSTTSNESQWQVDTGKRVIYTYDDTEAAKKLHKTEETMRVQEAAPIAPSSKFYGKTLKELSSQVEELKEELKEEVIEEIKVGGKLPEARGDLLARASKQIRRKREKSNPIPMRHIEKEPIIERELTSEECECFI